MKIFKSKSDISKLNINQHSYDAVNTLVSQITKAYGHVYHPENDGYVVLIESDDLNRPLYELLIPYRLSEIQWEGVSMINNHFHAIYLANNQFGISFLIPDEPWVEGELRCSLEEARD